MKKIVSFILTLAMLLSSSAYERHGYTRIFKSPVGAPTQFALVTCFAKRIHCVLPCVRPVLTSLAIRHGYNLTYKSTVGATPRGSPWVGI